MAREKAPSYLLSDAQWKRLHELYFGEFILRRFESTMIVLERKKLVSRPASHNQWQITDAGRRALSTAPAWCRVS